MKRFTTSALFSESHFLLSFQDNGQPDIQTLLNRIKVLEDRQKPSVADLRKELYSTH